MTTTQPDALDIHQRYVVDLARHLANATDEQLTDDFTHAYVDIEPTRALVYAYAYGKARQTLRSLADMYETAKQVQAIRDE